MSFGFLLVEYSFVDLFKDLIEDEINLTYIIAIQRMAKKG